MSDTTIESAPEKRSAWSRRETWGLATLFSAIYFIQGISEPTEGLIAQPVRALLRSWGHNVATIGFFCFVLGLPWSIKPLYGILTDFVPLWGTRHRGYLLLMSGMSACALFLLYLFPPVKTTHIAVFWAALAVPTIAVAFSDVVIDALMVEKGQPRGITGQLQSVQWASMYAAMIIVGQLGGLLTEWQRPDIGFLIGAVLSVVSFVLTYAFVCEKRQHVPIDRRTLRRSTYEMVETLRSPAVLVSGAFLFLWNFNPFVGTVLQLHMTEEMKFGARFYGYTVTLQAAASIAASVAYGFYCRRIPFAILIHFSIIGGIIATIAYWGMHDEDSAKLISLAVGFTYMTATMIQLDLAARVCTPRTAGTTFAALMALSNFGLSASQAVGSALYDHWSKPPWNPVIAFNLVVGVGTAVTACCWCLVPALKRHLARHEIK